VFVRPRPRVVELCLFVGSIAVFLLVQWHAALAQVQAIDWAELLRDGPTIIQVGLSILLPLAIQELVFRGIVLQRFRRLFSLRDALVLQAAMFAAVHWDMASLLPQFVFGLVAGTLRVAAGGLWPCLLMHAVWGTMTTAHLAGD
jgi:membrane protease YdiL (CAAX protease family)